MYKGLSQDEANKRLKQFGFNELPAAKQKTVFRIALEVMQEPMFILLIICGILYMLLGDYREGVVLLSTNIIIIYITFYQHRKTERSLQSLRQLSSPRALVVRDGSEVRIAGREVVPDDIVVLHEGDRVPADLVLLESTHLLIDESMLTGESVPVNKTPLQDLEQPQNLVFSGTLIVQGSGIAKVLQTGMQTRFGIIGKSLQKIDSDSTRLQLEMKVLIRNLFIGGGIISLLVIAAFYLSRGNFIQSVLNGLASAMAILPEEFPVVLTVFLALGSWRLSQKKVLTRHPSAIESLGSATVLCTDKTGTITLNKMSIAAIYTHGNTYHSGTADIDSNVYNVIHSALHASNNNSIDPMEKAIREFAAINNLQITGQEPVHSFPLTGKLFAMTRLIETNNEIHAHSKGAPEAIIQLCGNPAELSSEISAQAKTMAANGSRVLGVATAIIDKNQMPDKQESIPFRFLGLLAFEDPIRPEVPEAIQQCKSAGIQVKLITGDYPETAISIASQIGLPTQNNLLTGAEIQSMNDDELKSKITHTDIFARVLPEHKLRIVKALKSNNEIVAMTGDGVNDAPALKAANIGIAMGQRGTDVAREASSLVLLDDNFASIVNANRMGRRIFDNLQKAMSYIMAIHIPIIGLTLIPAFYPALPLLLLPLHIVFMELIIDPACSVAFESEQEEKNIMQRPPRNPDEKFFGGGKILFSIAEGMLLLLMVLFVYYFTRNEGHNEYEIRAITFSSLIMGNVFLILSGLSKSRGFLSSLSFNNKALLTILFYTLGVLFLIYQVPQLLEIFSMQNPGYSHFIPALLSCSVLLIILESIKIIRYKLGKKQARYH